jgi:nucleoid DNA-binding protein
MNRKELVNRLSEKLDLSKKLCSEIITSLNIIFEHALLTEGEIAIARLGILKITTLPRRKSRNPKTGEPLMVGPTNVLRFRPTARLKRLVKTEWVNES